MSNVYAGNIDINAAAEPNRGEQLLAAFEELPAAAIVVDERNRVRFMNPAARSALGSCRALGVDLGRQLGRWENELTKQTIQNAKRIAVGELASGVAHNFNNILGAILGDVQVMLAGANPPEYVQRLERIEEAALRGAMIAQRLATYARGPRADGVEVTADLAVLVEDVIELTRPVWKDRPEQVGTPITLHRLLSKAGPCCGNAAELADVLMNLLKNAVEAMPSGGHLTVRTWEDADLCCMSVRDTGIGMTDEVRQRAFDPFFTTKGPQSVGLGLVIARAAACGVGGEMRLESQPGGGTTVTVQLPAAQIPARVLAQAATPVAAARALRILLVDDDFALLPVLSDVVRLLGHEAVAVSSGAAALEAAGSQRFDLVITDLGMPKMTGEQLAARLKDIIPVPPVILLTGWGEGVAQAGEASGIDLVLGKPTTLRGLEAAIAKVMAR